MKRFIAAVVLMLTPAVQSARAGEALPNIVIILADDMGYGDVQALNPQRGRIATPNIDRLVERGMTFTDAHSGSSVCTPTRYGLLTGRYAWRTHLQRGVLAGGNDESLIAPARLTLPGMLKDQGYHTACIGKWHLGFVATPDPNRDRQRGKGGNRNGAPVGAVIRDGPTSRGFDYFWGCSNARTMSSLIENEQVIERVEPIEVLPRLSGKAVEYIQQRATDAHTGQPFFLYLPLTAPHTPIVPSGPWQGASGLGDYGDFVMQTDAVVGEVLDALQQNQLAQNTLVVFTADNGCSPQAGIEKLESQGHYPSERYRGYKSDIWDGGHRVPFVARWPGRVVAGSTSERLLCLNDLFATFGELFSIALPEDAAEDSVSFLATLLGAEPQTPRAAVVHHSIQGKFAIRDGQWKLCLCSGSGGWSSGGPDESLQLYDLTSDPGEANNLASQQPDIVDRLTRLLEQFVLDGRSTPGAPQSNDAAVTL